GETRISLRFNGAALVRARKSRLRSRERPNREKLQWGRARASAEIPRRGRASGQRLRGASMGPRSCERGNVVARESLLDRAELQWGRARASAEMVCSQTRTSRACRCFNGAALVRARKCIEQARRSGVRASASMGPRSCERGNGDGAERLRSLRDASMGPRSCERGNMAGALEAKIARERASMGPRSCERGNGDGAERL